MPRHTLNVPEDSPLHKKLVERIRSRHSLADEGWRSQHDKWLKAEELTLAYMPEQDVDRARSRDRARGVPKYTTIQIPYTYALLLSAHTYWTSVFFARAPVHQYSGRHGEGEMGIQALEALIAYQVEVGRMMGPYYIWIYDIGKYGCGILGEYWCEKKLHVGQLVEESDPLTGKTKILQVTEEFIGYRGNELYNCSVFDWMHDPRVPMNQFQKGEFVFSRRRMLWHQIEERRDQGYYINLDKLKNRLTDAGQTLGSSQVKRPQFSKTLSDYDSLAGESSTPSAGVFWEMYARINPKEWGLGSTSYPQVWCFTITEDLSLVVGATPIGYYHGEFPFTVGEAEIEGYGVYGRGLPEVLEPLQNTMDWLLNTHFYNVRATMNNQLIIDPSKIITKDLENAGPGFRWRLRPEAYGTDISKMVYQVPLQDVTRNHMGDIGLVQGMAERALGINDQIMGVLSGGGRKTATEVRTSTGFGVNRQKTTTEYISATAFGPHSQRLVQNSQQFYNDEMKLKIAGSFMQDAGSSLIDVKPETIAGFYDFVPVDGTLPVDRMQQANLWKEIMGSMRTMPPEVALGYDWGRIFGWVATLAGLKNIRNFKVEVMPDQLLQAQAAQGNVVPMRGKGAPGAPPSLSPVTPGNAASTQAGLNALGGRGARGY